MSNKTFHFQKVLQIDNTELWDFYQESSCLKRTETFGVFFCEEVDMWMFRFGTSLYALDKEMKIIRSFNAKDSHHSFMLPGSHGFSVLKFHSDPMPPAFPKFMEILQNSCHVINYTELDNYINYKETEAPIEGKEGGELVEEFTLHRKKMQELREAAHQLACRQMKAECSGEQKESGLLTPKKMGGKDSGRGEQENLNTQASTKNTLSMESLEQQNTEEKPHKKLAFGEEHESPTYKKSQGQEKEKREEYETPEGKETSEDSDSWFDKLVNPMFDFIANSMGTFMSLLQSDEYLEEFNRKYGVGNKEQGQKSLKRNEGEEEETPAPESGREYEYQEEEKSKGRQYQREESPKKKLKERDENEFWLPEETPPPRDESSGKTYPREEYEDRVPLLDKISAGYERLSGSLRKVKNVFTPAKKEINLNF